MTYFLDETLPAPPPATAKPVTSWIEGLGAAWKKAALENDANFRLGREWRKEQFSVAEQAAPRLGIDALNEWYSQTGAGYDHLRPPPATTDEFFAMHGNEGYRMVLDLARKQAGDNPSAWADIDLTEETMSGNIDKRLQAEHRDLQETLDMLPGGEVAELIGAMGGVTADVKNLPFLMLGGAGGSFLKVMAQEAAINVAAEGVFLPSQFKMAERLDIPDPNVARQLLMAAGAGALFGGLVEAGARGLRYMGGRNETRPLAGLPAAHSSVAIDAAEDALATGADPIEAASRALEAMPEPRPPVGPLLRDEANVEPDIPAWESTVAEAEAAFNTDFPAMRRAHPLADIVRRWGGVKSKRLNPATGKMEPTFAAQELAARGITPRTHPFLFNNKTGHGDLDNIVASESEGLSEVLPFDRQTGYYEPQGLIDALARELSGQGKTPLSGEIAARMAELDDLRSGPRTTPEYDFAQKQPVDGGFFVKLDSYRDAFTEEVNHGLMAREFDDWAAKRGFDSILTPRERQEILQELAKDGGEAEDLVYRALEREQDYAENPATGPAGRTEGASGDAAGDWIPFTTEDASRFPSSGRGEPSFEPTPAGQQALIPGVAPVSQRQRLEAQQAAPLRGGVRPLDDGLFDLGARQQMDMFSDPASKEARVVQDYMIDDIRTQIGKDGDFAVDMGDGKGSRPASSVLDDLNAGDKATARLDLCGKFTPDVPF